MRSPWRVPRYVAVKPAEGPLESVRWMTILSPSSVSTPRLAISPDGHWPFPCFPRKVHVAQLLTPSHSVIVIGASAALCFDASGPLGDPESACTVGEFCGEAAGCTTSEAMRRFAIGA